MQHATMLNYCVKTNDMDNTTKSNFYFHLTVVRVTVTV